MQTAICGRRFLIGRGRTQIVFPTRYFRRQGCCAVDGAVLNLSVWAATRYPVLQMAVVKDHCRPQTCGGTQMASPTRYFRWQGYFVDGNELHLSAEAVNAVCKTRQAFQMARIFSGRRCVEFVRRSRRGENAWIA
ncbi:MAG: hypothetical protein LBQ75_10185 [Zoogloeaceae bacterium]|nr:hypothetical protein [Zoogloeaceae bacterium]